MIERELAVVDRLGLHAAGEQTHDQHQRCEERDLRCRIRMVKFHYRIPPFSVSRWPVRPILLFGSRIVPSLKRARSPGKPAHENREFFEAVCAATDECCKSPVFSSSPASWSI